MTKKLLALLFAALMVITVMAGCQTTQVQYLSEDDSGTADDDYIGNEDPDAQITNKDGTVETGADGHVKTRVVTNSRAIRTKSTAGKDQKGKTTVTAATAGKAATRKPKKPGEKMKYTPIADAGADYTVKGSVSIMVDTVRPTDYDAMFDVMEQLYPNVEIKLINWRDSGDDSAREYLTNSFATGDVADIIWDEAGCVLNYVTQDWVYPLNDFIRNDPEAKYIPNNIRENYIYSGYLYALPHQAHFETTIFNDRLLEKAGLKLPKLNWTPADHEQYVRKAAETLYEAGEGTAWNSVTQVATRLAQMYANQNGNKSYHYGARGFCLETHTWTFEFMRDAAEKARELRMIPGADPWYMNQQKTAGGSTDLQEKLGINYSTNLFLNGKAMIMDQNTAWIDRVAKPAVKFSMTQWPMPHLNGQMGAHIDHCFITTKCDKENLPAAWQLLRFMTYSSNGNLARISMYTKENQKLYALNSHVYYPTTTNPAVINAFKALPDVTEADKYMLSNLHNSGRFDAFKLNPNFNNIFGDYLSDANDKVYDGVGDTDLREAIPKANAEMAKGINAGLAAAKANGEKRGVKAN